MARLWKEDLEAEAEEGEGGDDDEDEDVPHEGRRVTIATTRMEMNRHSW